MEKQKLLDTLRPVVDEFILDKVETLYDLAVAAGANIDALLETFDFSKKNAETGRNPPALVGVIERLY